MADHQDIPFGKLILYMGILVIVGSPMVGYLWETLNEVLSGYFDGTRLLISIPLLLIFAFYLRFLARVVDRLHANA